MLFETFKRASLVLGVSAIGFLGSGAGSPIVANAVQGTYSESKVMELLTSDKSAYTAIDECIRKYVDCVTYTSRYPCDTCLSYCRVQGEWDEARCPSVRRA
jgi:hypothetical protein